MRIKLVPDAEPNSDGFWVQIDVAMPTAPKFTDAVAELDKAGAIPQNHHVVAYEDDDGHNVEK